MGFLNLFSGSPAPASSEPAANTTPTTQPTPAANTASSAHNPFETTSAPASASGESPVPDFKSLWEPIKVEPPKDGEQTPQTQEQIINSTIEAARKIDFSKVIPVDTLTKIAAGGEAAQSAFVEAINLVNQATYAQSAYAAQQIAKQAVADARLEFQKELPNLIRTHNINDTIRGTDERYQDPEIAPLLKAIDQQITTKFPQATAAQIANLRTQYLDRIGGKIAPQKDPTPTKDARNGDVEDWSTFLLS